MNHKNQLKAMKKLVWISAFAMLAFAACDHSGVEPYADAPVAPGSKGKPVAGNYFVSSNWDGNVLSFTIDQSATQATSHILVQLIDCDGNYIDHVVSSSLPIDFTTGNGTGCYFDNDGAFFKFDDLDLYEKNGTFTLWMTFSEGTEIAYGSILIKSAKNCFAFDLNIDSNCGDPGEGHETAYAYGEEYAACFLDMGFSRWGWTNYISEGEYAWPIYAGAGQCDLSNGTLVGTLYVAYAEGTLNATYDLLAGYTLDKASHMYVGATSTPLDCKKNGCTPTVAPGQYSQMGDHKYTYTFTGLSGAVYVIAHAEVSW
jgi:hypothetical protein